MSLRDSVMFNVIILSVVFLGVFISSVIVLRIIMLSVIVLYVTMLSGAFLSVVMVNVVAPVSGVGWSTLGPNYELNDRVVTVKNDPLEWRQ